MPAKPSLPPGKYKSSLQPPPRIPLAAFFYPDFHRYLASVFIFFQISCATKSSPFPCQNRDF
ncbi:hypothetical protein AW736_02130 [Termitidicoccus mucosus]|uniref:Uncharacterized protein n=1 Tax=Termitidicoccus mucosus TaxID=1184151 RepID=A0A178IPG7_9BACT|nr:hypothetical protein AW736_02130 [Opitutaceae bacterium TSB47]